MHLLGPIDAIISEIWGKVRDIETVPIKGDPKSSSREEDVWDNEIILKEMSTK